MISLIVINVALYNSNEQYIVNSKVHMKNILNAENFFVFNAPYYYYTMNKKIALKLGRENGLN